MPEYNAIWDTIQVLQTIMLMGSLKWLPILTWFNFNPSMDIKHTAIKLWDEITYPFLNVKGATVEV